MNNAAVPGPGERPAGIERNVRNRTEFVRYRTYTTIPRLAAMHETGSLRPRRPWGVRL